MVRRHALDSPATPRSRKLYVLWAIALTLLLALGLFSWLVVVPVWEVHEALETVSQSCMWHPAPSRHHDHLADLRREVVDKLGGQREAARKLSIYSRLPLWSAPRRGLALFVLGDCGEAAVPALVNALGDNSSLFRRVAAESLCAIGEVAVAAVPSLRKALRDERWEVRAQVAFALGNIGLAAGAAIPDLKMAARNDKRLEVRQAATAALGEIGPAATSALQELLGFTEICEPAIMSLWSMSKEHRNTSLLPVLRKALKHPNHNVRWWACMALAELGPIARSSALELERLVQDRDVSDELRQAARETLKKIKAAQEKSPGKAKIRIGVGDSFDGHGPAKRLADKLNREHFPNVLLHKRLKEGGYTYSVTVGEFASEDEARLAMRKLLLAGFRHTSLEKADDARPERQR